MQVHTAATTRCQLGEAPLWHPIEQRLYLSDITRGRLYAFDPLRCEHELVLEGRPIAGLTWQADGSLLLFRDRGRVNVYREGKTVDTLLEKIPDEIDSRFNEVIAAVVLVLCAGVSTAAQEGSQNAKASTAVKGVRLIEDVQKIRVEIDGRQPG
jgi:D-xylonolactonase